MTNPFFKQKKGAGSRLDGRMTAYAIVEGTSGVPGELKGMIQDGSNVFAVQADCRQEHPSEDFFKSELGSSLKKGLDQVVQRLRESGLWFDQEKEDMDLVNGMAELIPIMARIVSFESEDEAINQEGDVYYLGAFSGFQGASMCAQAFSLMYQSRYREQARENAKKEIENLLVEIEQQVPENENFKDCNKNDLKKKLLGTYVPAILYSSHNELERKKAIDRLRNFMRDYRFPDDIENIISVSENMKENDEYSVKKLTLLLDKIIAFNNEDFNKLASIQDTLNNLEQ